MTELERMGEFLLTGPIDVDKAVKLAADMLTLALQWKQDGKQGPIVLTICSPGGACDGSFHIGATMTRIQELGFEVITRVQGEAASMGFVLAQFGTRRLMDAHASAHIHCIQASFKSQAATRIFGDMRKWVDDTEAQLAAVYAGRNTAGFDSPDYWRKYLDGGEHYFTAPEALELGLIDEVTGGVKLPQNSSPKPLDS